MGFWDAATDQAGRQFGARHWRWFIAARVARAVMPLLSTVVIVTALAVGALWVRRSVRVDWTAIGDRATGWTGSLGGALLWAVGAGIALLLLLAIGAWVHRSWWRWSLSRPWMRRY